ncbi:GntR family transcriptional regulator [Neobacillus massiliamazoniensis]|uniref:GntR family transcriptional regulator n=1 Tax=Neobacillus massiliamazoniensis TaxID=1499688 RepID=A0A0U1NTQ9_9BACI|nr:GntR family transcriptional regulator [Neobacillus massiliamazoniensis]CRK81451.1 GntR family transcriptional regulator [Neobacillus massiliamazoniensis]
MINKNSPIPIYYQLEAYIKQQIESGDLKEDDAIPSEREFAEKFQISRMTVRQAINNLVLEGYLYRQKGRGTFVNKKKVEQELQGMTSFTEDMVSRGMTPSSKLLSFDRIPADSKIAEELFIAENDSVYKIKRIRLADGAPMALETAYIPVRIVPGLTEENSNQSLYRYIEENLSLSISEARQEIEASIAGVKEAEDLAIEEGAPILFIVRTSYLGDGTPFELVKSSFRADRYRFVHTMKR